MKKIFVALSCALICFALTATPVAATGGELSVVSEGITSILTNITGEIKAIATPIAVIAIVVCGIKLLIASDPQSVKSAKSWLITIIIALAVIYLAEPLVTAFTQLSQNAAG